jgi:general secretion pathway protein M
MTTHSSDANSVQKAIAGASYLVIIGILAAITWIEIASVGESRASLLAAENLLAQLEGRSAAVGKDAQSPLGAAPAGSAFLEGQTVNVAGAALLQRIGAAVNKIGGNVLSSQVELQKAESKDGWVGLVVSCEIEQASLQQLLYDVEAGMPFLFVDQLVVQAPIIGVEKSPMRIVLAVSGLWQGAK